MRVSPISRDKPTPDLGVALSTFVAAFQASVAVEAVTVVAPRYDTGRQNEFGDGPAALGIELTGAIKGDG